jgi:histidine triad (HIT) family protein
MEDCIFCKIAKGEIPCAKLYENEHVLAFLDLAPVNKGHALVIPKKHHQDLLDMPEKLFEEVGKAAKKIAEAMILATGAEGFNIGQNNGKASGQIVMHFHLHVIPRFETDGLKPWPHKKYEDGEIEEVRESIVKNIR